MTVSTLTNTISYTSDGVQTIYAYDFLVLDTAHIVVTLDKVVVSPATYTVGGVGDANGGDITFNPAPAAGNLLITRTVPIDQEVDYITGDAFPAETHEAALDKLTMIAQQQQEQLDRAALGDPEGTDLDFILSFGDAATRAGKIWAFDATGNVVIALDQAQDIAYRWANAPEDEVVQNIGGQDRYSAYHWALKAETIVSLPLTVPGDLLTYGGGGYTAFAAGDNGQVLVADDTDPKGLGWVTLVANLPGILPGDALKAAIVKADETGYELKPITADILRGAGGWAEDDESDAPAIQTAVKTNHGKQVGHAVPTACAHYRTHGMDERR